jgi:hypothetical protein
MIKVYDIETFANCFTYTDYDVDTKEVNIFVISNFRDDHKKFKTYLSMLKRKKAGMVGFNNLHFDWPVTNYIWETLQVTGEQIYSFVQHLVSQKETMYTPQTIKQLDLYLLNHYDNKARSCSLKALEVALHWKNVMDMPFSHTTEITEELLENVLEYNLNDVLFTAEFYDKCKDKIDLRKSITQQYGLAVINKSDVVIGEMIFLKYLSDAMDQSISDLKSIRGKSVDVPLKNIIFKYVSFRHKNLQDLLEIMKGTISSRQYLKNFIDNLDTSKNVDSLFKHFQIHNIDVKKTAQQKKSFSFSVNYADLRLDYGVGGIHACVCPGIYSSSDVHDILDIDVKSYYPNLFIQNRLHPRQMDQDTFVQVYSDIFQERVKAQKEGDKLTADALKLSLNGLFGKTGSDVSCFYDPNVFYGVTVNGQLLITMLVESLYECGCEILQINTDGVTIRHVKTKKDELLNICKEWEEKTKLTLEYANYNQMIIRDVNNYIAVGTDGKVKEKGCFETKKDWHKDNSFMVVPLAVRNYFVDNTPIEETLVKHKNIYDFCGRYKAGKGWHAEFAYLKNNKEHRDNYGRIYRFLPVKSGGVSLKLQEDGREHQLLDGYQTRPFNVSSTIRKSDLNYLFYVRECQKLIDTIKPLQKTLF